MICQLRSIALVSLTVLATTAACGTASNRSGPQHGDNSLPPTPPSKNMLQIEGQPAPAQPASLAGEAEEAPALADDTAARPNKLVRKSKKDSRTIARSRRPVPTATLAAPTPPPKTVPIPGEPSPGTEQYTDYGVNPFVKPSEDPLSTFAIDVDTGAYTVARSKLRSGSLPPFQSVRAEEFLNYFDYNYASPQNAPFSVHLAAAPSPYDSGHHILRVGVQAKRVSKADRTPVHLVYLVDTSGSMHAANKLGLAKASLRLLTNQLKAGDTVALCTYAGSVREVLPPTGANNKGRILEAINMLTAGGGTAMSSGVELAYKLAQRTLVKGHVNRVIVLSDGDANIGRSSHQAILKRIGHFKDMGITLSTIGFGRGNYKDTMMEQLANKGDGNYSYIDTRAEARRVFGEQVNGLLQVVARDVKIQVEFDPRAVKEYRLIGYENRDVADRDFRNDAVDAGEIGAGHNVTALYDVVLNEDAARDRSPVIVRLRHKSPQGSNEASELAFRLLPERMASSFKNAPRNLRLATAVAGFAEILRQSPHAKHWQLSRVERIAQQAAWGKTAQRELIQLIAQARRLRPDPQNDKPVVMAR